MIFLHEKLLMLKDDLFYFTDGFWRYSDVSGKSDRVKPEFALAVR